MVQVIVVMVVLVVVVAVVEVVLGVALVIDMSILAKNAIIWFAALVFYMIVGGGVVGGFGSSIHDLYSLFSFYILLEKL